MTTFTIALPLSHPRAAGAPRRPSVGYAKDALADDSPIGRPRALGAALGPAAGHVALGPHGSGRQGDLPPRRAVRRVRRAALRAEGASPPPGPARVPAPPGPGRGRPPGG